MKTKFFEKDSIKINYIKEGQGESLVFIPGHGANLEYWSFQIPFFKERMMVIALDNRGSGKSSRPNYSYTMDMFAEDVKNLLDFLEIRKKIHICGHGMGSLIALNFTHKYPQLVKSLILCATAIESKVNNVTDAKSKMIASNDEMHLKISLNANYTKGFKKIVMANKDLREKLKRILFENKALNDDYKNQGGAISSFNLTEMLPKIKVPVLILNGEYDHMVPLINGTVLHDKISGSKFEILKNLGHGFLIEASEEVNTIVWDFIKSNLM